jgi:hypothetical protein
MANLKTLLKEFLRSPALAASVKLARQRRSDAQQRKERIGDFLRGDAGAADLVSAVADAVTSTCAVDGLERSVWGFGGPGTARFAEALGRATDGVELETVLRNSLVGIDIRDPSEALRSFAGFVVRVAQQVGTHQEPNLHVGYATCFLSFCWHLLYDGDLPVFYGGSHKGIKELIASGVVTEPGYASRDLGERFRAFLRVCDSIRGTLQRVNSQLDFWTVEAFFDWFVTREHGAAGADSGLASARFQAAALTMPAGTPDIETRPTGAFQPAEPDPVSPAGAETAPPGGAPSDTPDAPPDADSTAERGASAVPAPGQQEDAAEAEESGLAPDPDAPDLAPVMEVATGEDAPLEASSPAEPEAFTDSEETSPLTIPARAHSRGAHAQEDPAGDVASLASELGCEQAQIAPMWRLLENRGRLLIRGPFGAGKTHTALRLARAFASPGRVALIALHPMVRYSHLVEREAGADGSERDGVLNQVASQAREHPGERFALVLDDLGSVEAGAVIGEWCTLLQHRDESVLLPCSGRAFQLPPNLHVIATDGGDGSRLWRHRLWRLFPVVRLEPDVGILRGWLARYHPGLGWVADVLEEANQFLLQDVGADGRIGHGTFMRPGLDEDAVTDLWRYEVLPRLQLEIQDPERLERYALDVLRSRADSNTR